MSVFIPDNPPERSYSCPGCQKGIKAFRVGDSSTYLIMDGDDDKKTHSCGYNGTIPLKAVGFKPPKVKA
jgi:hypothetical protein